MRRLCNVKDYLIKNKLMFILCVLVVLFPPVLFLYGVYCFTKKNYKLAYLQFALFLGWLAYCTIPYDISDLSIHYQVMERLSEKPINRIFDYGYEFVYLNNLIMWIIGHLGNYALYQGALTFIGYYFLFKYVDDISREIKVQVKYLIIILIFSFFLSYYRTYIFAIRNYFCFIVGTYFYYKYQKAEIKQSAYLMLIFLLSFIHPGSLIFYILFVFDHISNKKIEYIMYFLVFFNQIILMIAKNLLGQNISFLNKLFGYVDLFYVVNINSLCLYFLCIVFAMFIIYRLRRYGIEIKKSCILLIVLNLSLVTNQELLKRFIYLVPLFLIELLFYFYKVEQKKYIRFANVAIIGLSIASFIYMWSATVAYGWTIKTELLLFPIFSLF